MVTSGLVQLAPFLPGIHESLALSFTHMPLISSLGHDFAPNIFKGGPVFIGHRWYMLTLPTETWLSTNPPLNRSPGWFFFFFSNISHGCDILVGYQLCIMIKFAFHSFWELHLPKSWAFPAYILDYFSNVSTFSTSIFQSVAPGQNFLN